MTDLLNSTEDPEPITQRQDLLTKLIADISELESEAAEILDVVQEHGMTPYSKSKTALGLLRINRIIHNLEDFVIKKLSRPPRPF
jgi:hypothetical protein